MSAYIVIDSHTNVVKRIYESPNYMAEMPELLGDNECGILAEDSTVENYKSLMKPPVNPFIYRELRAAEYPSLGDFADAFVKQQDGDPIPMQSYVAACLAVKAKYPKTEGV